MSASNKKKLRKEQAAEQLTARQLQERNDAKQLKIYTISFLTVMALIICTVGVILGVRAVRNGGWAQKRTIAATIGGESFNTVEMNYYYIDAVNGFYNQWNEYYGENTNNYLKSLFGLDPAVPLNQQHTDEKKTQTWAQHFIEEAVSQAQHDVAMYNLAVKEGFKLSDAEQKSMEATIKNLDTYASAYGFSNADKYLSAIYGPGAQLKTYKAYYERSTIAAAYYAAHEDTFVYTDEQREAYAKDKASDFNSYDYTSCYLSYTSFRGEGTKDEAGKVTYTKEQDEAARKKAEEAANELAKAKDTAELKELAKKAPGLDTGKTLNVEEKKDTLHTSVSTEKLRDWLASKDRKAGDIAVIPNESTTTDADGKETKTINGYYVVIFNSVTDNATAMADIGYIFVPYKDGVEDETTGDMTYDQEGKDAAKADAESFLKTWQSGEKTKESMEKLANDLIKEKKASKGGLVENINKASNFADDKIIDWALSTERAAGNTTILEADDGFYILYYAGKSKLNYRHYMIDTEMRAEDYQKWYEGALAAVPTKVGNTSKMDLDLVLSSN